MTHITAVAHMGPRTIPYGSYGLAHVEMLLSHMELMQN